MKKICCGITLYNPSMKNITTILEIAKEFDKIFLYDNTENNSSIRQYFSDEKFIYIYNSSNDGLAKAYNIMCNLAIEKNFDYICLLDQDSKIDKKSINKIMDKITKFGDKDIAIFSPRIEYSYKKNEIKERLETTEVSWVISSGSFINLHVYNTIGGFDENYFIDRLDYDYSVEVKKIGKKIMIINDAILLQELGERKKFLFFYISEHEAIRHYYIFRNRLYFFKKNKTTLSIFKIIILSLKHILRIIFLEKNKKNKLKKIYKGFKDYKNNKMGKFS